MKKTILAGTIVPLLLFAIMSVPSFASACDTGCGLGNGVLLNGGLIDPLTSSVVINKDSNSETVTNSNTADVTNSVTTNANTGGNTAYGGAATVTGVDSSLFGSGLTAAATTDGGLIATGDATAQTNIDNEANANNTIVSTPVLGTDPTLGELSATTLGADNTLLKNTDANSVDVVNSNDATINNPVATNADTGDNTAFGGVAATTATVSDPINSIYSDPFFGNSFSNDPFFNSLNYSYSNCGCSTYSTYNQWLQQQLLLNAANTVTTVTGGGVVDPVATTDGGHVLTGDSSVSTDIQNNLNTNTSSL